MSPPEERFLRAATHSYDVGLRAAANLVQASRFVTAEQWIDAHEVLDNLVRSATCPRPRLVSHGLLGLYAEAALHAGVADAGRSVVSKLAEGEGTQDDDVSLGELLYATAILSEPHVRDACYQVLLAYDPDRWPWLSARTHLAYGSHLRRHRRGTEARHHLRAADLMFASMGARSWQRRATRELRAAGVRDPRATDAHPNLGPLSAQERQIVALVAQGLSNREIGTALFLSPRTIGSHLYRIFPKLNVTSRAQLAALVAHG
jgi:DNA-binding CsgD family transcriptional regulator